VWDYFVAPCQEHTECLRSHRIPDLSIYFIMSTFYNFTWLDNPVWQCTCDKAMKTQHTGSHFLVISSVLCDTNNGRYEQLFHCGAFGSKLGCIKRQLRSGNEWSDDNISEVIWVAILAQSNSFIMRKMRLFVWQRGAVDQISQTVTYTTAATLLELSLLKCVQKLTAELGVPRLTVFDKKKPSLLTPSPL